MTANGNVPAERLRSFIERVERLEEEKVAIAADIREVYAEAKSTGFDTKVIREIIKQRKKSTAEREEFEALLDLYKGTLGMLNDTPLGEAARRRLARKYNQPAPEEKGEPPADESGDSQPEPEPEPMIDLDAARADGRDAALDNKPVTDNPYPAGDPRRAAWDEAWCGAMGSDGMDIPEAWQPSKKKKPKKGAGDDAGGDQGGDQPDKDAA